MNEKIFKQRYYKHIDKIIYIKDVELKIKDPNFVKIHGFYPFISYELNFKKFTSEINSETNHHYKIKSRPIKYASHIDRCIYQWYSYKLNEIYNNYCNINNLNNTAIAYRTCLKGKTNIDFAKYAFDNIKSNDECFIMVSDFSSFFDNIDHKLLKNNLCNLLNVQTLSDDMYKVYKSMTKYSYIEKTEIEEYLISKNVETKESIIKNNSYFDKITWNEAKKDLKDKIIPNTNNFGIPQGSPLSGVYANIYMMKFDKNINEYVKSKKGIYMRYSDDLIIIIPKKEINSINDVWNIIELEKRKCPGLKINIEKTSGYIYKDKHIVPLYNEVKGMKKGNNFISYLGFSFDGSYVKFRDKTLTKFYYRLYRKINSMIKREEERIKIGKKKVSKIDKHYILKTLKASEKDSKKFVDYVKRAKKVFKKEKYIIQFEKNVENKIFIKFQGYKHDIL